MEIFTISNQYNNRETLIETFDSFIWTERYSSYGDFELVAEPSLTNIQRLVPGTLVGFDQTDRIMIIDTVERTEDSEGKNSLKVNGKSFEYVLNQRIAKNTLTSEDWQLSGTPGGIIAYMVNKICVLGTGISSNDIIDINVQDLTTISSTYNMSIKSGTLYERVKEIADIYSLGFRVSNVIGGDRTFQVYEGSDLTGPGGVAFSEELDNLANTSLYTSHNDYKNVAYVLAKNGSVIVDIDGNVNPAVSGLDRSVLFVDATNIDLAAGASLTAVLIERGRQELAAHQHVMLFDGLVDPNGIFQYNRDYSLGDIVVFKGDDGVRQNMRVTEYIYTFDAEGYRAYPTLSS